MFVPLPVITIAGLIVVGALAGSLWYTGRVSTRVARMHGETLAARDTVAGALDTASVHATAAQDAAGDAKACAAAAATVSERTDYLERRPTRPVLPAPTAPAESAPVATVAKLDTTREPRHRAPEDRPSRRRVAPRVAPHPPVTGPAS